MWCRFVSSLFPVNLFLCSFGYCYAQVTFLLTRLQEYSRSLGLCNQNKTTSRAWCSLLLPRCIISCSSFSAPACSLYLRQLLAMFCVDSVSEDDLQLRSSQRVPFSLWKVIENVNWNMGHWPRNLLWFDLLGHFYAVIFIKPWSVHFMIICFSFFFV